MDNKKWYTVQVTLPENPWHPIRFLAPPVQAGSYQEALDKATRAYGRNATGIVKGVSK
jgi:hypothetical protein